MVGRDEVGVLKARSADPVLAASKFPGRFLLSPGPAEKDSVRVAKEAVGEREFLDP